jgi:hypothetical protein
MTVNFVIRLLYFVGVIMGVISIGDYVKTYGMEPDVTLADAFENIVVLALAVVLWGLSAALTSVAAIDQKLHDSTYFPDRRDR